MTDWPRTLAEIAQQINTLEGDRRDCWRQQEAGAHRNGDIRTIETRLEQLYDEKRRHMTDVDPMGLSAATLRQLRRDSMIHAAQRRQADAVTLRRHGYERLMAQVFGHGNGAHG